MGVFDSVKKGLQSSGLVSFDPTEAKEAPVVVQPVAQQTFPSQFSTISVPNTAVAPDGEIVSALNQAADKSQKPGYAQFRIIFDTMQGLPDVQRYPMALRLVEASHKLTPDMVIASIEDRINLVSLEDANFSQAWQQEYDQTVAAGQKEIEKIATQVEAKKQEIRDLEQKRIDLTTATGAAQVKLETERATFNVSADIVRTALTSEKQKLTQYLVPPAK